MLTLPNGSGGGGSSSELVVAWPSESEEEEEGEKRRGRNRDCDTLERTREERYRIVEEKKGVAEEPEEEVCHCRRVVLL